MLIAFIHHLARSLSADIVVARLAHDLSERLGDLLEGDQEQEVSENGKLEPNADQLIQSNASGYVQTIDSAALVESARKHGTKIVLSCRAGHFVSRGEAIAALYGEAEDFEYLTDEIRRTVVLGPDRTDAEDPEYAFQAIVEIALRALSPGVNDPYTALTCLDWLGDALSKILSGSLPGNVHRDASGNVRLISDPVTVDGLFNVAFNDIRQAAEGNVAVLIRLAETVARLRDFAQTSKQRELVQHHLDMVARASERSIAEENDRADMKQRLA